ncbi:MULTISPECIES: acyl-CoA dehydrogenase family protein [unclassified Dietzia]|uniref:acyl-CoA dehydrogenase family protein n=1 Tax=unclassified Dietzia TaxID=2617939 RepID=UPI0015F94448|nr:MULTISPECIES: acyl-CoA dehydrogenase family protein [unclassified Dietzia]MBB1041481.1 acyl-CoA dehydrogenase [Dietzia sp. Cai40]MBB1043820.1 acyl-CoA dehydrogenase [Dietzia sp. DQ11-44]MBB1052863.1 acyl-CoA dehydrogenase [Dietzia sp. B44]
MTSTINSGQRTSGDQAAFDDALRRADLVAAELGVTAAERDRANAAPTAEIDLLRRHDLLQVGEPVEFGGSGLDFAQSQQITRRIARGDTSIAHLIGYHYAQQRIPHLFGTPEQAEALSRRNAEEKLFWGGVQNPRGADGLELTRDGDAFRLNGRRTFASGASVADHLSVTASFQGDLVFLTLPTDRPGFEPDGDWDAIGQRLTDSGGVEFRDARVERHEILGDPDSPPGFSPYQTLVTPHWQLAFVNFYIGTAEGAFTEALDWTRLNASPWETSGLDSATEDPYILELIGEQRARITGAALLADRAGAALQQALDFGPGLSAEQRAETAIAIAEAKFVTTKVSLEVASRLFEIQGARATSSTYGFDRHWRNPRTHTVHDPVAYKAREIGDWTLNHTAPAFTLYS